MGYVRYESTWKDVIFLTGIIVGVALIVSSYVLPYEHYLKGYKDGVADALNVSSCYFEVYDNNLNGMRIRVYNFTVKGYGYGSNCEGLEQMCRRQGNETDGFVSTDIPCVWNENEDTCECYPYAGEI